MTSMVWSKSEKRQDGREGKEGHTLDVLNTSDVDAYRPPGLARVSPKGPSTSIGYTSGHEVPTIAVWC